jgi:hypothetical protein
MKPPEPHATCEQRFEQCKEAIELSFLELIDAATAVGWEAEETALAVAAVSASFISTWLYSQD